MRKFNIAIIGAGNIGRVHAQAIAAIPAAELVAIYDTRAESAQQLAREFSTQATSQLADILKNPMVDIVTICTPSGTHAEIAVPAAFQGKHLFVEKPMDITLEKIDHIISAVKEANVSLAGIFPSRFRIGVQKTYAAIQQGRLGRLALIQGSVKWYRSKDYYRDSWRGTFKLDGGGALMNQSIHTIDLVQWLGGKIKTIYGKVDTLHHQIEAEDTASALLEFENGAQGILQGATGCWPGDPARIEIHGDKGTVHLEDGRIVKWDLAKASPEEQREMLSLDSETAGGSQDPMGITSEFHRLQLLDFMQAITEKRSPAVAGEEARKAVEIILAIYNSSKLGQPVELPLSS